MFRIITNTYGIVAELLFLKSLLMFRIITNTYGIGAELLFLLINTSILAAY